MTTTPVSFKEIPLLPVLTGSYPGLKAIFFDMDGTLFNSEDYHAEAFLQIGAKYKIIPPYSHKVIHELLMGKADHLVFEIIKSWEGFPKHWTAQDFVDEKNRHLLAILESKMLDGFLPTLLMNLIRDAKQEKIYLALVTSSEKVITEKLLALAKIKEYFDLILTRDDCPYHKPHPWPYLEAMKLSRFEKHEILIFEDSKVGLEAATSAGAHVIKVEWF